MRDLTNIIAPFGELERDTQIALFKAFLDGEAIECSLNDGGNFVACSDPVWDKNTIYRVGGGTPDKINWNHVAAEFKHLRRDAVGTPWLFTIPPFVNGGSFWSAVGKHRVIAAEIFTSYKRGTAPWETAGSDRPEGE
jgi:hypothetical protein